VVSFFSFCARKKKYSTGNEHDRDADPTYVLDGRSFFARDSAATHGIVINVIESEIGHVRHYFFQRRED